MRVTCRQGLVPGFFRAPKRCVSKFRNRISIIRNWSSKVGSVIPVMRVRILMGKVPFLLLGLKHLTREGAQHLRDRSVRWVASSPPKCLSELRHPPLRVKGRGRDAAFTREVFYLIISLNIEFWFDYGAWGVWRELLTERGQPTVNTAQGAVWFRGVKAEAWVHNSVGGGSGSVSSRLSRCSVYVRHQQ